MYEITLSGPGKNALGTKMMHYVVDELNAAQGAPVLLRGEGGALSAGLNLKEFSSLDDAALQDFLELLETMCTTLFHYPGPTVALVDGHAIAGGCVLVQCCDLRIAADNPRIKIGLNELQLGVHFPPATFRALAWRIPSHHRDRVILGAELHPPTEALRLGLLDIVTSEAEGVARAQLAHLGKVPRAVYSATKAALRHDVTTVSEEENRRFREEHLPVSWSSPDLRARITALLGR